MAEKEIETQSPRAEVTRYLFVPQTFSLLLDGKKSQPFLKRARGTFSAFTPDQAAELTTILIMGIATDNEIWGVNRRDGAVALLGAAPLHTVAPEILLEQFTAGLLKTPESADPLGSIESLLKAGNTLIPHFPLTEDTEALLTHALDDACRKLKAIPGRDDTIKSAEALKALFKKKMQGDDLDAFEKPTKKPETPITPDDLVFFTPSGRLIRHMRSTALAKEADAARRRNLTDLIRSTLAEAATLPPDQKLVVEKLLGDGMTLAQVGRALDMSPTKVAKLRNSALRSLGFNETNWKNATFKNRP